MIAAPGKPSRPVLRYFGGKFTLAPWIIGHFPPHRIYVEPFGGAASVLMQKTPSPIEVYNDLSGDVVNVFRVLQDPLRAAELERKLRVTPWSRSEYETARQKTGDPVEDARRVLIASFQAHGSSGLRKGRYAGWRSQDSGANGHASHAWATFPDVISSFCRRLAGVVIECRDALEVIPVHDGPDTLYFVDPPYVRQTRSSRHGYECDYTDKEHRKLAACLKRLRGMVIVCGYPSELYERLYPAPRWQRVSCEHVKSLGKSSTECLWLNRRARAYAKDLFA